MSRASTEPLASMKSTAPAAPNTVNWLSTLTPMAEANRYSALNLELKAVITTRTAISMSSTTLRSRLSTAELAIMLAHLNPRRSRDYSRSEWCAGRASATLRKLRSQDRLLNDNEVALLAGQQKCVDAGEQAVRALAES